MGSKEGASLVKGEGISMMEMFSITSAENQQSPPPTTWSGLHEEMGAGASTDQISTVGNQWKAFENTSNPSPLDS